MLKWNARRSRMIHQQLLKQACPLTYLDGTPAAIEYKKEMERKREQRRIAEAQGRLRPII